jgi:hypothetical protein
VRCSVHSAGVVFDEFSYFLYDINYLNTIHLAALCITLQNYNACMQG